MARHYIAILESASTWSEQPIGSIDILGPEERRRILEEWNLAKGDAPDGTFLEIFQQQVERAPDAAAVFFEGDQLTYFELNKRVNRLAHLLIGRGVAPEDFVGIALPRSLEAIVAMLGVLKAGAAYLPLDPNYPPQRLAVMLEDATPACIVTMRDFVSSLPQGARGLALVGLDESETIAALEKAPAHNPSNADRNACLLAPHPAYIIYTSGSTGVPKGVIVSHAGIPSLAVAQVQWLNLGPESRVLQFASISFDASFWEMLMALTTGGVLILRGDEMRSGAALGRGLLAYQVTHACLLPSVVATLEEDCNLLTETLVVGMEACPGELAARWSVGRRMINAYGPTETTVIATLSDPLSGTAAPPIGKPIWNTRVYVLDERLEPAPVGVGGHLYAAGLGLARGYWKRALLLTRLAAECGKYVGLDFSDEVLEQLRSHIGSRTDLAHVELIKRGLGERPLVSQRRRSRPGDSEFRRAVLSRRGLLDGGVDGSAARH